jgi:hypothetical protein
MDPVSTALLTTAIGAAGGIATASMNKAPKPPAPVRVPQPDDPDQIMARKKKMEADFAQRQGRDSTQLTPSTSADQAYSRTTLG